jgi:hypothetical protein
MAQAVALETDAVDVRAVMQHLFFVARAQFAGDLPMRGRDERGLELFEPLQSSSA